MPRVAAVDPVMTRQRVLDAACALFSEYGVGQTSIRDIAGEAGVSLSTVMHHFYNKEGLYESCVNAMYTELEDLRDELERLTQTDEWQAFQLDEVIRRSCRFAREHRAAIKLVMRTVLDRGEMDRERRLSHHLPFLESTSSFLGAATGQSGQHLRLSVQSLIHLIVRYALTNESELAMVAGLDEDAPPEQAVQAIEDHVVDAAKALLAA